ncbi:MAG: TetR/AcrR family transcriptional regulator [Promethearchaeota archaeon]
MSSKKKNRARSPEKKDEQFERILEEGKKLFIEFGRKGIKMRALAKKLNMSQANLYNYVESKRELWFAIRKKYLQQYLNRLKEVIKKYKNSLVDLTEKWGEFFFEFAEEDYLRFQMIWNIPPPPAKKIGPIEKAFKKFRLMDLSLNAIKKAFQVESLNQDEATEYFYFMIAIFYGVVTMERFIQIRINHYKEENPNLSIEKFRKFILKKLRYNAKANFK